MRKIETNTSVLCNIYGNVDRVDNCPYCKNAPVEKQYFIGKKKGRGFPRCPQEVKA